MLETNTAPDVWKHSLKTVKKNIRQYFAEKYPQSVNNVGLISGKPLSASATTHHYYVSKQYVDIFFNELHQNFPEIVNMDMLTNLLNYLTELNTDTYIESIDCVVLPEAQPRANRPKKGEIHKLTIRLNFSDTDYEIDPNIVNTEISGADDFKNLTPKENTVHSSVPLSEIRNLPPLPLKPKKGFNPYTLLGGNKAE